MLSFPIGHANIFLAMPVSNRNRITAFFVIARFIRWETGAAAILSICQTVLRTAAAAFFPIGKKTMMK